MKCEISQKSADIAMYHKMYTYNESSLLKAINKFVYYYINDERLNITSSNSTV